MIYEHMKIKRIKIKQSRKAKNLNESKNAQMGVRSNILEKRSGQ